MFDTAPPPDRQSVVEVALRRRIDDYRERQPVVVDFVPHGSGALLRHAAAGSPPDAVERADARLPPLEPFRRMLQTGGNHLAAAKRAFREQARQAAIQARELAAFAQQRPAALLDLPDDEVGAAAAASRAARPAVLTEVSEWAVDEVMAALNLSSRAASQLLADSVALVEQLPATLNALEAGTISWSHARMLVEVLSPLGDADRAEVEERLLAGSAGKTVAQLKAAAQRAVLRADASAATRRLAAAIRERRVVVYPGEDGMATLSATLPTPVALACRTALESYAAACATPGDERTTAQRMVDCLADLILRGGSGGLSPVQAQLTVVASVDTLTGGNEPGEVDGQPVPAMLVRELAHALGLLPRPDGPVAAESPASEQFHIDRPAEVAAETEPAERELTANEQAAMHLGELLGIRDLAGTSLMHMPTVAVVEEISGQVLALTDATEIRRTATCGRKRCRTGIRPCGHPPDRPGLGPPPDTPDYAPSAALARFVRARDRRCRFPGCRARAVRCDLDHNVPWPQGATSAENLCCLCRHHHRLSHQAPGWRLRGLSDGGLEWTTPSGETITTYPLRYGADDDLPLLSGLPDPADDPPPF